MDAAGGDIYDKLWYPLGSAVIGIAARCVIAVEKGKNPAARDGGDFSAVPERRYRNVQRNRVSIGQRG